MGNSLVNDNFDLIELESLLSVLHAKFEAHVAHAITLENALEEVEDTLDKIAAQEKNLLVRRNVLKNKAV